MAGVERVSEAGGDPRAVRCIKCERMIRLVRHQHHHPIHDGVPMKISQSQKQIKNKDDPWKLQQEPTIRRWLSGIHWGGEVHAPPLMLLCGETIASFPVELLGD